MKMELLETKEKELEIVNHPEFIIGGGDTPIGPDDDDTDKDEEETEDDDESPSFFYWILILFGF